MRNLYLVRFTPVMIDGTMGEEGMLTIHAESPAEAGTLIEAELKETKPDIASIRVENVM